MTDPRGVAIGIPAHNEAEHILETLESVLAAARGMLPITLVVAVDASRDATESIARRRLRAVPANVQAHVVRVTARRAGVARQQACRLADACLRARVGEEASRWIATTDADTIVPIDWLSTHQRWAARGADAITGLVRVAAADALAPSVRMHLDQELARAGLHHGHVFGANLGVSADWWNRVGGFPPRASGEDVVLVARLRAAGARVIGVPDSVVTTSGRLTPRAPSGFGATLASLSGSAPSGPRLPTSAVG